MLLFTREQQHFLPFLLPVLEFGFIGQARYVVRFNFLRGFDHRLIIFPVMQFVITSQQLRRKLPPFRPVDGAEFRSLRHRPRGHGFRARRVFCDLFLLQFAPTFAFPIKRGDFIALRFKRHHILPRGRRNRREFLLYRFALLIDIRHALHQFIPALFAVGGKMLDRAAQIQAPFRFDAFPIVFPRADLFIHRAIAHIERGNGFFRRFNLRVDFVLFATNGGEFFLFPGQRRDIILRLLPIVQQLIDDAFALR